MPSTVSTAPTLTATPMPRVLSGVLGMLAFTALTALASQVRVPLPFSPIPMTLQTVPVILSGLMLGGMLGVGSQVLFVLFGVVGLPFFAGGESGVEYLGGPTAGFLVGFILAPWVAGHLTLPVGTPTWRVVLAGAAATAVIFACGVSWLAFRTGSVSRAVELGLTPFIVGGLVKLVLVTLVARAWYEIKKFR